MFGFGEEEKKACDPRMKRKKDKERQGVEEEQEKAGLLQAGADEHTNTAACSPPHHPIRHPSVTLSGFLWKLAGAGTDKHTSVTHALHTLPKQ